MHVLSIVMLLMGVNISMGKAVWMGPAVAILAFIIAAARRTMATKGWGAVHEKALPRLIQEIEATPSADALQAALAGRAQQQGWLSWSCVMDALSKQGLPRRQFDQLRSALLCSWGPVHTLHGPVATRNCFRRHVQSTAWNHASLDMGTIETKNPVTARRALLNKKIPMPSENTQAVSDLTDADLIDQFEAMTKWWHYDPMGASTPSAFDVDDLRAEITGRMAARIAAAPSAIY